MEYNTDETFKLYEDELDVKSQANNLVEYMEATMDNDTSDEKIPEIEEDPLQSLWPLFYGQVPVYEPQDKKGALKLGKSGYEQPVESLSTLLNQLVPLTVPRQTQHDWKKAWIKALGPNNNMRQNYFIRKNPINQTTDEIDPNLHLAHLEPEANSVTICLESHMTNYLSAPSSSKSTSKSKTAQAQFDACICDSHSQRKVKEK